MFNFRFQQWQGSSPLGQFTTRWTGRPSWVWGTALLIGLLPFALLIGALAIAGLVTAAVIYVVLSAVHELIERIRGVFGYDGQGRRNVRVRPGAPG